MSYSAAELGLRYLKYAHWLGHRSFKLLAVYHWEDFHQITALCAVAAQPLNDEIEARRLIGRLMYHAMRDYGFRQIEGRWRPELEQPDREFAVAKEDFSTVKQRRVIQAPGFSTRPLSLKEPERQCSFQGCLRNGIRWSAKYGWICEQCRTTRRV